MSYRYLQHIFWLPKSKFNRFEKIHFFNFPFLLYNSYKNAILRLMFGIISYHISVNKWHKFQFNAVWVQICLLYPIISFNNEFFYNDSMITLNVLQVLTSTTRKMPSEVLDMIVTKKVLLAACAYTVNDRGRDKINFTLPIFMQTYSFLTTKPGQLSRALLFTAPFTKEVNFMQFSPSPFYYIEIFCV